MRSILPSAQFDITVLPSYLCLGSKTPRPKSSAPRVSTIIMPTQTVLPQVLRMFMRISFTPILACYSCFSVIEFTSVFPTVSMFTPEAPCKMEY